MGKTEKDFKLVFLSIFIQKNRKFNNFLTNKII